MNEAAFVGGLIPHKIFFSYQLVPMSVSAASRTRDTTRYIPKQFRRIGIRETGPVLPTKQGPRMQYVAMALGRGPHGSAIDAIAQTASGRGAGVDATCRKNH
jgi:hypothetical protein